MDKASWNIILSSVVMLMLGFLIYDNSKLRDEIREARSENSSGSTPDFDLITGSGIDITSTTPLIGKYGYDDNTLDCASSCKVTLPSYRPTRCRNYARDSQPACEMGNLAAEQSFEIMRAMALNDSCMIKCSGIHEEEKERESLSQKKSRAEERKKDSDLLL